MSFKNNAPFISSTSKANNTLIDNVEDLDIVMPLYNLLENSKNYSKTSESLWNYYKYEPNRSMVGNKNCSISNSKSFDYKTSITGQLEGTHTEKNVEIVAPLEYSSNIWRILDIPIINCEVSLTLTWSVNCVITNKAYREADPDADPNWN